MAVQLVCRLPRKQQLPWAVGKGEGQMLFQNSETLCWIGMDGSYLFRNN